jgi:fructose-bisphosphate aldolase class II
MPLSTMKEILADARERKYGVPFFNTINQEMVRACIAAAETHRSPVIIGTAEALLPYSDFDWIAPCMTDAARRARVPVAIHLDHTYRFEVLMRALRAGFGSVMYDGSSEPYEINAGTSAEVVRIAHAMGAGVEAELGRVGGLEGSDGDVHDNIYTDPDLAERFVRETGVDFLAVSIGTVHGVYREEPSLQLDLLADIHSRVSVPLVLHGGSGLSAGDIRATIERGICKVNVYTDVVTAAKKAIAADPGRSYPDMCQAAERAMEAVIAHTFLAFGSAGKA